MSANNDEFEKKLNQIPFEDIRKFLREQEGPVYESLLLKFVFKNMSITNDSPLTLYQNHFILFHALYNLQDEYYKENKYLHVHFMRIHLADYPEKGRCRFYNEENGLFCRCECEDDSDYCGFHSRRIGAFSLEHQSSKYFYLDKSNYYKLDKNSAEDFINGSYQIISNYEKYKKSFDILELPESSTLNEIKRQYKYLAKKYHPDSSVNPDKNFAEINDAYNFLIKTLAYVSKIES